MRPSVSSGHISPFVLVPTWWTERMQWWSLLLLLLVFDPLKDDILVLESVKVKEDATYRSIECRSQSPWQLWAAGLQKNFTRFLNSATEFRVILCVSV